MSIKLLLSVHEFQQELVNISKWWADKPWDSKSNSLHGEVDSLCEANISANKSIILYARALWFFSEAAMHSDNPLLREKADHLYRYLELYFNDAQYGGFYWEIGSIGEVINARKQTFAQAFTLYAYSAYYALTNDVNVLNKAEALFDLIESKTLDTKHGGHLAAYSESWVPLVNMAIDENDINAPKTLDTELHILEAYTAFYKVAPFEKIADAIQDALSVFDSYFIDKHSCKLKTHLSGQWEDRSKVMICGHLFESAWLIWEAVSTIPRNPKLQSHWRPSVLALIEAGLNSYISKQNYIFDSQDVVTGEISKDSVWWVQSEALIACFMAYDLSEKDKYLEAASGIWAWIKAQHIDNKQAEYGEWHAVISDQGKHQDVAKAFMWKGPYHNGRAMLKACQYLQ